MQFYDNGQLRYWGPAHNILDKTSLNGPFILWYENGQRKQEGSHKDGKQDGLHTWWYRNGQKKFERTNKDGELVDIIGRWKEDGKEGAEGNN